MSCNVHIIIQARLGSSRLPRKVLKKLPFADNVTLLEYMYGRLIKNCQYPIAYAIPIGSQDNELAKFLDDRSIPYYRGSEDDVLARYFHAARFLNAGVIVRLTSDCPLVDPHLIEQMVEKFLISDLDYLGNTCPPNLSVFPDGSDVEIFNYESLERAHESITDISFREHVTFQFWREGSEYRSGVYRQSNDFSHLRYTIDNVEDLDVFDAIHTDLISKSTIFCGQGEIQNFLNLRPDLQLLNKQYAPGDNWK